MTGLQWLIVARAHVLWALFLGQGVVILSHLTGIGWLALTQGETAHWRIVGLFIVSGLVGILAEGQYRRRRE